MSLITFSTLACPGWSVERVISNALTYGYGGIEWRGGPQGHVQPDISPAQKSMLRQMCSDSGLTSLAVTAYTGFVSSSAMERQANVDELKRYSDLAAELGARYVRTFLGELPAGTSPDQVLYENISDCLRVAADHAQSLGVIIAIEPHDDFVRTSSITPIITRLDHHPALRVIWDIANAFSAGEDPADGFEFIKDVLAYVQVKDGKKNESEWMLCQLGKGNVPLRKAIEFLLASGYQGAYSVEWEYAWHPELDPPEIALPEALRTLEELLSKATVGSSPIAST